MADTPFAQSPAILNALKTSTTCAMVAGRRSASLSGERVFDVWRVACPTDVIGHIGFALSLCRRGAVAEGIEALEACKATVDRPEAIGEVLSDMTKMAEAIPEKRKSGPATLGWQRGL